MEQIVRCAEHVLMPLIPRENLPNYREYPNLISLGVGSVHIVDGWRYIIHYGAERLGCLSRLRYGPRTSTCLKHFNISYYYEHTLRNIEKLR